MLDSNLKKKLIYHFWCPTSELTDDQKFIINLHLQLLNYYSPIFDDVQINIACDDTHYPLVNVIRHKILDIFNNKNQNVCIRIVQNTILREGKTCREEIFASGREYDGIVFFGHSKGITNVLDVDIKHIMHWITALYWLSLNDMDEVENKLFNTTPFFGSLLVHIKNASHYYYSGSFYWTNLTNVKAVVGKNLNLLQNTAASKVYAEEIPNILFPIFSDYNIKTHNDMYVVSNESFDFYNNVLYVIKCNLGSSDNEYNEYMNFSNIIFNRVNTNYNNINLF